LLSALFIQTGISVGASGALFGLLGGMLSELITNWTIYANKVHLITLNKTGFPCKISALKFATYVAQLSYACRFLCAVSSTDNSPLHHCNKSSGWTPPTCGQLCSYWRISLWLFSGLCVLNSPPV